MTDLNSYRLKAKSLARESARTTRPNAAAEHASVFAETLFSVAEKQASVLSGTLKPRVYGRDEVRAESRLSLAPSYRNQLGIVLASDSLRDRQRHSLLKACCGSFRSVDFPRGGGLAMAIWRRRDLPAREADDP